MEQCVLVSVLDTVHGRPAAGVVVRVERIPAAGPPTVRAGVTDEEGRWTAVLPTARGVATHRVAIDTGAYFTTLGVGVVLGGLMAAVLLRPDVATHRVTVLAAPGGHAVYVGV